MKLMTVLGLLTAALVVVLGIASIHLGWFSAPVTAETGERVFLLAAGDVREVSLAIEGRPTIHLVKHGNHRWRMVRPVDGPADADRVSRAIRAVLDMRIARLYAPSDPKRPEIKVTGLDTPRLTAALVDHLGESHAITIGRHPPLIAETYARVVGASDILLAGPDRTEHLIRPFGYFRAATLLELDLDRLRHIAVIGRERYALTRRGDRWHVAVAPDVVAVANDEAVKNLLAALGRLQITGFVAAPTEDLEALGLDPPLAAFVLETSPPPGPQAAGEKPEIIRLALGASEGGVYAMLNDDPWLMTVTPTDLATLTPTVSTLRDRRVLAQRAADIRHITIRHGPLERAAIRQGDAWISNDDVTLDEDALRGLLAALTEARVTDFVTTYATLAGFGLDRPAVTCILADGDGAAWTIHWSVHTGTADSQQRVYVKRDDDPTVMMVHAPELIDVASSLVSKP